MTRPPRWLAANDRRRPPRLPARPDRPPGPPSERHWSGESRSLPPRRRLSGRTLAGGSPTVRWAPAWRAGGRRGGLCLDRVPAATGRTKRRKRLPPDKKPRGGGGPAQIAAAAAAKAAAVPNLPNVPLRSSFAKGRTCPGPMQVTPAVKNGCRGRLRFIAGNCPAPAEEAGQRRGARTPSDPRVSTSPGIPTDYLDRRSINYRDRSQGHQSHWPAALRGKHE